MALIKPLHGITYNLSQVNLDDVTTPPYDIINTQAQEDYYNKSPFNMIRLDLGNKYEADSDADNRYTRAAEFFTDWRDKNVLVQAPEATIYAYRQTYELGDSPANQKTDDSGSPLVEPTTRIVTGIVCLVKLEEFGQGILPHEKTLSAPREDRYRLLKACHANFSPVFALFTDESGEVSEVLGRAGLEPPALRTVDEAGTLHEVFPITKSLEISALTTLLATRQLLIADGHHRYETSLNFYKDANASGQAPESYQYIMMYLVDMATEALTILPTHRVLNLENLDLADLADKLPGDYRVSDPKPSVDIPPADGDHRKVTFDLYARGRVIRIEGDRDLLAGSIPGDDDPLSKHLDTAILQKTIFDRILGISSGDPRLSFKQDVSEAIKLVDSNQASLAVFLNPTDINQIIRVAESGEKMPQKSTFFYPKPRSGLIINSLD